MDASGDAVMQHISQSECVHAVANAINRAHPKVNVPQKRKTPEEQLQQYVDGNRHLDAIARELSHVKWNLDRSSEQDKAAVTEKLDTVTGSFWSKWNEQARLCAQAGREWGPSGDHVSVPQSERPKIKTLPLSTKRRRFGYSSSHMMDNANFPEQGELGTSSSVPKWV